MSYLSFGNDVECITASTLPNDEFTVVVVRLECKPKDDQLLWPVKINKRIFHQASSPAHNYANQFS